MNNLFEQIKSHKHYEGLLHVVEDAKTIEAICLILSEDTQLLELVRADNYNVETDKIYPLTVNYNIEPYCAGFIIVFNIPSNHNHLLSRSEQLDLSRHYKNRHMDLLKRLGMLKHCFGSYTPEETEDEEASLDIQVDSTQYPIVMITLFENNEVHSNN